MRVLVIVGLAASTLVPSAAMAKTNDLFTPVMWDLTDPDAVFDAMREKGATDLPIEALAYYEAGIKAARKGNREEAIQNLSLAAELDAAFPEAHLALARLTFPGKPQTLLGHLSGSIRATWASFGVQHLLLVNSVFGFSILITGGLLLYLIYVGLQLLPRVHHSMAEHLRTWFPSWMASVFGVAILLAPGLWRIGALPFAVALLGLMWPWLRTGERAVGRGFVAVLVLTPLLLWGLSPLLYPPLDPAERPFLVSRAMASPYSPGILKALNDARDRYPDDPSLYFALAMVEKRGGHFRKAEILYRRALELGANPASVYNNLGVMDFLRGDYDRALTRLQKSVEYDDQVASSHFNLSQTYAKKLFFEKADQELFKANQLSFNRIRATLRHSEGDDKRTMIDEPLHPPALWATAWASPRRMPGLPGWMEFAFPGSLWLLPPVSLVVFAVGLGVGRRLYRHLPTFACTNCRRPVCRRCLRRIRREAYCTSCGDALLRIQGSSYSRLVLDSRIRRNRRVFSVLSQLGGWFLPGLHAARTGRTFLGLLLTLGTVMGVLGLLHRALPVTRLVWIENSPGPWWPLLPAALLVLVVTASGISVLRIKPKSKYKNKEDEAALRGRDALVDAGRAA